MRKIAINLETEKRNASRSLPVMYLGASVAQSSEQAPFTSEIMGSVLATDL